MRFLFFLGPSARGLRPQAVGERTFSPVTTTTIRQGRGHNVCPAVSRDGEHIDSKQCLRTTRTIPPG